MMHRYQDIILNEFQTAQKSKSAVLKNRLDEKVSSEDNDGLHFNNTFSKKITTYFENAVSTLEEREQFQLQAKSGDPIALACLGAKLYREGDTVRAFQYFKAAVQSESNKNGTGALEDAIANWIEEPYEKAKYYRLAMSKGHLYSGASMKLCLPRLIAVSGYSNWSIGAFHRLLEEANYGRHEATRNWIYDNNNTEARILFTAFLTQEPQEFKKLCIQSSKAKIAKLLGEEPAQHYFSRFQNELVDKILEKLIREDKDKITDEELEEEYGEEYHLEYFKDINDLINIRLKQIEETLAPDALTGLERLVNTHIRELLALLGEKDEAAKDPGNPLTSRETVSLETFLKTHKPSDNVKALAEFKKVADSLSLSKKNEPSAPLAFSPNDTLPPPYDENTLEKKETYPNTKKLALVINTVNQATQTLSTIHSPKTKKQWGLFVAGCTALVVSVVGIPLFVVVVRKEYRKSATEAPLKQKISLFKQSTKKHIDSADHLPSVRGARARGGGKGK